jgi:exopolysaccharide production protein ExoZ
MTINNVQYLRGLAALAVVLHHAMMEADRYAGGTWLDEVGALSMFGQVGVDLFFVISGFIMVHTTRKAFGTEGAASTFFGRRLIRVVPMYWLYTTLFIALTSAPPLYALKSYLFLPVINPDTGFALPALGVGWTLTYEMYFYAVFAAFLLAPARAFLPGVTAFFLGSAALSFVGFADGTIPGTIFDPLLLEFLFGCWIASVTTGYRSGLTMLVVGTALLLVTLASGIPLAWRFLLWGVPAALVVAGAVFMERARPGRTAPLLLALGNSSYSLYLSHGFTQPTVGRAWSMLGLGVLPGEVFVVVCVAASAVVGWLSYVAIEKPLTRWLQATRQRPVVAAA